MKSYDHPSILAGQGTIALEIIEEIKDVDAIIVPTGGAGLVWLLHLHVFVFLQLTLTYHEYYLTASRHCSCGKGDEPQHHDHCNYCASCNYDCVMSCHKLFQQTFEHYN